MPVAGLPLAGREFAVALDAGEPAGTERRPRVGVPATVERVLAERAHLQNRVASEFDDQRVRPLRPRVRFVHDLHGGRGSQTDGGRGGQPTSPYRSPGIRRQTFSTPAITRVNAPNGIGGSEKASTRCVATVFDSVYLKKPSSP